MIYLTSDTFFGRASKAKERGFRSTEEMQISMINSWNEKIKPNDIVYHLGNFAWDIISAENALLNLNGRINFLPSMYDMALDQVAGDNGVFEGVKVIKDGIFTIESLELVLCPWPLKNWPGKAHNVLHIHGGDKRYKANLKNELRFNANCDLWSLSPISLDSLLSVIKEFNNLK